MKMGFVGLGLMGGALARNLIRAGYELMVYDLREEAIQRTLAVGGSGRGAQSLGELGGCELVFTSLPLPRHVEEVMSGPQGLYGKMPPGGIHVELSTIDPASAMALAGEAKAQQIAYIQCTLGKTPAQAEKAQEPMFIGGDQEAIAKLEAIFKVMGIACPVGTIAASCAVKLISNLIGMTNLAVLAEGLRVGEKAGLDKNLLLELLADTGARSFQMDVRGPWLAAADFTARFGLDLALKDVRLGLEMARGFGLELGAMEAALGYYTKASAAGYGLEDCNAVLKVIGDKAPLPSNTATHGQRPQ